MTVSTVYIQRLQIIHFGRAVIIQSIEKMQLKQASSAFTYRQAIIHIQSCPCQIHLSTLFNRPKLFITYTTNMINGL